MDIDKLIKHSLEEDIGAGDVTSIATIPENKTAIAKIVSKDTGIICGIQLAEKIFHSFDNTLKIHNNTEDGQSISKGFTIMEIEGKARSILSCERTVLNFIQRLSGVATIANKFSKITLPHGVKILDTRKTSPLLRELEKYAVKTGGGKNHRFGLYDMVLIKDNHIAVSGSITKAVEASQEKYPELKIEVETESLDMVKEALESKADRIMLDNMTPDQMKEAVKIIRESDSQNNTITEIEASGGISESNLEEVAKTGIDYISIGSALTNASRSLDLSLDIEITNDQ